jgi:hypothetical protein
VEAATWGSWANPPPSNDGCPRSIDALDIGGPLKKTVHFSFNQMIKLLIKSYMKNSN